MAFRILSARVDDQSMANLDALAKRLGKCRSVALRYALRRIRVD